MSYAYLFKYIIIGDTGKSETLRSILSALSNSEDLECCLEDRSYSFSQA